MIAVAFDTETTGLTLPSAAPLVAQPRVIEVGGVKFDEFGEIGRISQLIDPLCKIDKKITEITGLKNHDLKGKPSFAEFATELEKFFFGVDYLICHNASFDKAVLDYEFSRLGRAGALPTEVICTANEYEPVLGFRPRLVDLYLEVCGVPLPQTHRAMDDAVALYEILQVDGFLGIKKKERRGFFLE